MNPPSLARRLKTRYTRVVKMGEKWNTYLQIDHQGFCVVEQTTRKGADWFARMLGVALARVVENDESRQPGLKPRRPKTGTR